MTSLSDKKPWNRIHKSMLPKPSSYNTFSKKSQSESQRLEEENQKMESRLNDFKNYLKSEKDKRLHANKIWSGGEVDKGSLSHYAKNVLEKKKNLWSIPTKISYLKNDSQLSLPIEKLQPKPPSTPKMNNEAKDMVSFVSTKLKWRIPSSLGRCAMTPARKSYAERVNAVGSFQKSKRAVAIAADQDNHPSDSLLVGTYNETDSHNSFHKALAAWRGEKVDAEPRLETPTFVNLRPESTQTTGGVDKSAESLNDLEKQVGKLLMDSSSLSYMDKILLSKLRASSDYDVLFSDLNNVNCPPSEWIVTDEQDTISQFIPKKLFEVVSIEELGYDDCFMGDEILDSKQIIIEEPI